MQNFMRMHPKVLTRETLTEEQLGEIIACNYSDSTLESFNLPTRVEDDVDEGDEGPPQASGLGQLLNFFNSGTTVPKTANSGLCCAAKRT